MNKKVMDLFNNATQGLRGLTKYNKRLLIA